MCLEMVFRRICLIAFPGTKVKLTNLFFGRPYFLPILECHFLSCSLWELNLRGRNLSELIKCGFQGHCHQFILSGPMSLCASSFFRCFLVWSSSGKSSPQIFSLVSQWPKAIHTSKDRCGDVQYLCYLCVLCHYIACPTQQQAHIFPNLPFAADRLREALLVLHIPCLIQLQVVFGSPNPSLHAQLVASSCPHFRLPMPASSSCIWF